MLKAWSPLSLLGPWRGQDPQYAAVCPCRFDNGAAALLNNADRAVHFRNTLGLSRELLMPHKSFLIKQLHRIADDLLVAASLGDDPGVFSRHGRVRDQEANARG
jgi:hypothetical protein